MTAHRMQRACDYKGENAVTEWMREMCWETTAME